MELKTNFIIACDQAFLAVGSNNLNLIGIFSTIHAEQFPFTYPRFSLVTNFDTDATGMHRMSTQVLSAEGKQLIETHIDINITSPNFQVIAHFENLAFPAPGRYELRVTLDDHIVGSRFLHLSQLAKQKINVA